MKRLFNSLIVLVFTVMLSASAFAQYQKPPKAIADVLDSPATPATSVSPSKDKIALLEPLRYPPIAELAQPMLRIAGLRINPNNTAQHRQAYAVKVTLKNVADGKETPVALPAGAKIVSPAWSADGKYIAAGNVTDKGVELWIIETATAKARLIKGVMINSAFGGFTWMPDQMSVLVNAVPTSRGAAPLYRDVVPASPNIQETAGKGGLVQTFQDLLKSPNDEALFEYYATSQIAIVGVNGKVKTVGAPAIFDTTDFSPDGKYVLTSRIKRPFSYLFPFNRFPRDIEVWDASGKVAHKVASVPLLDNLPPQGVQTGPRAISWIPTEPATLMWVEALDGGNTRAKAEKRDKLLMLAAPFTGAPKDIVTTDQRYQGRMFGEKDGLMFFFDFDRTRLQRRIFSVDYRNPQTPRLISDLNINDRYNDPGQPVMKRLANGYSVMHQQGDSIFMTGAGASPKGDLPFLRRMSLKDLKTEEIFRSDENSYESFVALGKDDGTEFITRRETTSEPPNLFVRYGCPANAKCEKAAPRQLTSFTDTAPQLRGITKKLVRYKRADGVDLSFTLYLPPGYKEGTPLPTVVWAYPESFTDASTAGQVTGSTNRFTQIGGYSHLFFLLEGYAVLDNTSMPIVGKPETKNDTFVQQIVDAAKAAIDKGVELGVVDRNRVGVGGHSYGAFMTANLLAHSDLFKAGIARSGAYNRTLTPFGFQDEERTFWQAQNIYTSVSPFFFADKIKEPILMIHGEADNNQGTFPIQSERLYAAIQGNGGTARLVMLPLESHGYAAKESIDHVLYEQSKWFDKYVKNAPR
jgi:dipeptidyl aminopeptidase/acylaminoacyl peptidase